MPVIKICALVEGITSGARYAVVIARESCKRVSGLSRAPRVRFGSLADIGEGFRACPLYPQKRTFVSRIEHVCVCANSGHSSSYAPTTYGFQNSLKRAAITAMNRSRRMGSKTPITHESSSIL